jgi:two-component system chemotaxis response regulator CheB
MGDESTMRAGTRIIAIGTSAGGLEAIDALVAQLPTDLPASVFIVQHMAPESTGDALLHRLRKYRAFESKLAEDGELFKAGRIYVARPDYHMLVKNKKILVTKGARENRFRPGIDPLFRSAAVNHGPRVIGVVLTGMLNDGTSGLGAISRCGGITVVQDPQDAAYPDMPQNAISNVNVDYCLPVASMGELLERLTREAPGKSIPVPEDIRTEAKIAERVLSDVAQVNTLGAQVPYNCPNCGGVLWQIKKAESQRYRCHTGHSFTARALLGSQSEKIEETLWISLRMLEERKNLLHTMAENESRAAAKRSYTERAKETEVHIERIRAMLLAPESAGEN